MPALESQSTKDATQLVEAEKKGLNADCVFQGWDRDRQMSAYRELNKIQSSNANDHLPGLTLYQDESGAHLVKEGSRDPQKDFCPQAVERERAPKAAEPTGNELDDERWQQFGEIRKESAARIEEMKANSFAHPEDQAEKIQGVAENALTGPEAEREPHRLALRRDMERLMKEDPAYRNKVLDELERNGSPRGEVKRDSKGEPQSIEFSKGFDKDTISLNQTVEEQVDEAQRRYRRAIEDNMGIGDPASQERRFDIATEGAEPELLRWFMLARKEEDRPAVDP